MEERLHPNIAVFQGEERGKVVKDSIVYIETMETAYIPQDVRGIINYSYDDTRLITQLYLWEGTRWSMKSLSAKFYVKQFALDPVIDMIPFRPRKLTTYFRIKNKIFRILKAHLAQKKTEVEAVELLGRGKTPYWALYTSWHNWEDIEPVRIESLTQHQFLAVIEANLREDTPL